MIISRTPFRISFAGGGSDLPSFYHRTTGAVLSTSIDKYMYIAIHPFFDQKKIQLKYSKTELVDCIDDIHHPIFREVLKMYQLSGVDLNSIADIPSGTGLGSSSAFTVGLLNAVRAYLGKATSGEKLGQLACDVEIHKVGSPIGKQDQYAAACGGLNFISFYGDETVNSYSFEKEGETITFPILLDRVAKEVPDMRIRFTTSHPKDMSDDTLRVIAANDNICKFIHLPAQSGSSRILKVMNRKYTREWYLDRIAAIRRIVPDCAISTDLFCGFHSETEEDYQETLSLMREVGYDSAFLFKYSERPGTYAASHLEDNVPEEEKVRRLQGMIDLQNKLSEESNLRDIGKTFEVLIEGFSKRSREQLFGRTSQNKVVIFDKKNYHVGQFIKVKIHKASSATLFGEPVEE